MINSNDTVRTRILLPTFLWLPIAAALIARFYVLQIEKHDYYLKAAEQSCITQRKLEGRWGEILDRDGNLLVGNRPCVRIICSPCDIKPEKRRPAAELLGKYLDKDAGHYYERLNPVRQVRDKHGNAVPDKDGKPLTRPNKYLMLGRTVPVDTARMLREEMQKNGISLNAFSFQQTYTRVYPKKCMLSNVIGYSNLENDELKPQAGIEKGLARETAPHAGQARIEISRDGIPLNYGLQNVNASRDGKNIYLTISEPIQSILEEELDAAWEKWSPDAVYAAIATPDGHVLAIAQRPNFDPSDRSTFSSNTLRNRIAMDGFEPGSVMKPFTVAKALDWGIVTPDSRVDCEGGRWIYCGKAMTDTHHNEKLTVSEVIKLSSNIGTAKIALMLGEDRLETALSSFGFGSRSGIGLPHESAGTRPRPAKGDKIGITRIPIGYAANSTVLQLLRAYCTLANGGMRPQLRLIDRLEDPKTGESTPAPFTPPVRVFEHPEALEQLITMMIGVTQQGGTATQAAIPGYDVAGKTGTSNKHIVEFDDAPYVPGKPRKVLRRRYASNQYYASFAGFVPARSPKLVMVVTVDNPRGKSHFGGSVSGPIFARTAKRVLEQMNVPPDHPEELLPPEKKRRIRISAPTAAQSAPAAPVKAAAPAAPVAKRAPAAPAKKAAPRTVSAVRKRSRRESMRRTTAPHRYTAVRTRRYESAGTPSEFPRMTKKYDDD